jgi:hypothetical protein
MLKFDQQYDVCVEGGSILWSASQSHCHSKQQSRVPRSCWRTLRVLRRKSCPAPRANQPSTIPIASPVNLPVNFKAPQSVFVAAAGKTHLIPLTNSTALSEPLPSSFGGERMPFCNEFLLRIQQDSLFHDPLLLGCSSRSHDPQRPPRATLSVTDSQGLRTIPMASTVASGRQSEI